MNTKKINYNDSYQNIKIYYNIILNIDMFFKASAKKFKQPSPLIVVIEK